MDTKKFKKGDPRRLDYANRVEVVAFANGDKRDADEKSIASEIRKLVFQHYAEQF